MLTNFLIEDKNVISENVVGENANLVLNAVAFCEDVPETFDEIKDRDDKDEWMKAVREEMNALKKTNTWDLVPCPQGRKPIKCKWVFTLKRGSDGNIERYKARLVVKGCSQRQGLDYTETYAPVARMASLRTLLSIIYAKNMYARQLDVKNAFLNGVLKEDIYMCVPEGLKAQGMVCKLKKTLYGLKQAPKEWNERFHEFITRLNYSQCITDKCLYVREVGSTIDYVLLYVDDIIVSSNERLSVESTVRIFSKEFEMRDLGDLNYFLGIKIERKSEGMFLSQTKYVEKLIKKFKLNDANPRDTPLATGVFCDVQSEPVQHNRYRELIGGLMYACVATRPDIAAAISFFSQYQSKPTKALWTGLKRVLCYLKGTKNYGLLFKGLTETSVLGYVDADFANHKDRKSVSGYVFKVFGDTVVWASRKQRTVALSTTEAEFLALASATAEMLWLCQLLVELRIQIPSPIVIFEDNQGCINSLTKWDQKRLKHVDVKWNFVRDLVIKKILYVQYLPTDCQLADIFTKGLPYAKFANFRTELGLSEI